MTVKEAVVVAQQVNVVEEEIKVYLMKKFLRTIDSC